MDWEIGDFGSGSVAQILDIELEIALLHRVGAERIHVFHHEVPHRGVGRCGGAFEHLQVERLVGVGNVARKFAHLVGLSLVGVFVCHGEHLVGVECRLQRDVAEGGVEGVFA